ncbi:MAG: phage scaffolding protein [Chloroflexota bacterium]|nr:phage scaffolding protein [Chloroflexota bacterium]
MKREDLKKLLPEAEDGVIDQIMALHGRDIEGQKQDLQTAQKTAEDLQTQLTEANETIEGFKKLDPEAIQKQADDWKAKAEQAEQDAKERIAKMKFDHALEDALSGAKAKNPKAVQALLDMDALKLNEADGSIVGLNDQLSKIQEENDFLFDSEDDETPTIVKKSNGGGKNIDSLTSAVLKGAGIKQE